MNKNFADIVSISTQLRQQLHQNPEPSWQETETASTIRQILDQFEIPWKAVARTGTVAYLGQKLSGSHVALRSDIDALVLQEKGDVTYRSRNPDCMHACGHDGHTATLINTAIWLKLHEDQLGNPVSLLFQPAEEGGHGAKQMIADGALDGVDYIYGWHNWPAIKFGQAVCPDGIVMAGNGTFHIDIKGHGGHSSQPELARDPVLAAAAITLALQQIVSRKVAPQKVAVVSVTSLKASSGVTTIPSKARLEGSIRVSDNAMRDEFAELISQIAESTAASYGVEANVEFRTRYSATINNSDCAHNVRQVLDQVLGKTWQSDIAMPIMASEDFFYYLEQVPGAFALIGSDDGVRKHQKACHNDRYDFNDNLIAPASKILMRLAGYKGSF